MKKATIIPTLAVGAAILAAPLVVHSPYVVHLLIIVFYYAYQSSSWSIVGGLAGQVSLGHAVYAGIGAYTSTILFAQFGLSPWIGMLVGGGLAALVSLAIAVPCLRLKGTYYTLATIAFAETFRLFVIATERIGPFKLKAAQGLLVPLKMGLREYEFASKLPFYYIIVALLGLVLLATWAISRSKLGHYLVAIREDQAAAEALGIDPAFYKIVAAALSAFMTALGGTFYAQYVLMVDPFTILGMDLSVLMMVLPLVGGQRFTFGPLLGAAILVPISELATSFIGGRLAGSSMVIYGIAIVLTIYFLPEGLLGYLSPALAQAPDPDPAAARGQKAVTP